MSRILLDTENLTPFISEGEIEGTREGVLKAHQCLVEKTGAGRDFLGWLDLPSSTPDKLLGEIEALAEETKSRADALVCIGIGGSYLGTRAATEFINHAFFNELPGEKRGAPGIYYAGQNISSDYLADLADILEEREICLNVISKSGTTTEPAIAFRFFKALMEKRYGKKGARERIVVTTDGARGALKRVAEEEGYRTFVIPDDVGGRFSVLTPVGLFPIAVAGIAIRELMAGAGRGEARATGPDPASDPACRYAVIRNLMYNKGKTTEILATFHPALHYLGEWWKQLAGESEGKEGKGIFPAAVDFTTDLHSMGQWIQEGKRTIFETFLTIGSSNRMIHIPAAEDDGDGLNYISGKSLDYVNDKAWMGTAMAHREGGVPNMTIRLPDRSAGTLGELFYFFERAIALSGYLLGVNPFDQPGVEFYKRNMFKLLGKKT